MVSFLVSLNLSRLLLFGKSREFHEAHKKLNFLQRGQQQPSMSDVEKLEIQVCQCLTSRVPGLHTFGNTILGVNQLFELVSD